MNKIPWNFEVDGEDLVVRNIKATCFGGKFDIGDNGQTESGTMNDGRDPNLMGIALPIRSIEKATRDSPLAFKGPHIPWHTKVKVWLQSEGEESGVIGELIDNGPDVSKYPDHALDMNPEMVMRHFPKQGVTLHNAANTWSGSGFCYRIIGGAKYIS
jgi:hypothetical protein